MGTSGTTFSLVIPLPIQGQIDALQARLARTTNTRQKRVHEVRIQKLIARYAANVSLQGIYDATAKAYYDLTKIQVAITNGQPSRPDVTDIVQLLERIYVGLYVPLSPAQKDLVGENLDLNDRTQPPTPMVSESDGGNQKTLAYLNAILIVVSVLSAKSTTFPTYAPAIPPYIASLVTTAHHLAVLGHIDSIGQAVELWKTGSTFTRPPQVAGTTEETYFLQYIAAVSNML